MNAAEQAKNFQLASKIATVVNLFKEHYPAARADLKPWVNEANVRPLLDPDSIDIGFHFPGISRSLKSRSILMQVRLYEDPEDGTCRAIGIEATGHDYRGQCWRFSTVESWHFEGDPLPNAEGAASLKAFFLEVIALFNNPVPFTD